MLLDLGLPKLDGMSLLRWIRQHFENLPVMILTARDGVSDRVEGLLEGADDYLTKPFNNAEFAARVQALLRRACRLSIPRPGRSPRQTLRNVCRLTTNCCGSGQNVAGLESKHSQCSRTWLYVGARVKHGLSLRRQLLLWLLLPQLVLWLRGWRSDLSGGA